MQKNLLKVENVPNVKKTRIDDYRFIYYISDNNKFVTIPAKLNDLSDVAVLAADSVKH